MDINGIFNRPAAQSVSDAIQDAATATGASFDYMLAAAQAESGLNPHAASPTSSARGLYQFTDQTWLATLKRSGTSLGYGVYADAVVQGTNGRYDVSDPTVRRSILALRDDPGANAAMAGALTRDNAQTLTIKLGRAPSDGELYLAHVLGATGAVRLASLAQINPAAAADSSFPAAADANRSVFYDRQGRARSIGDVRDTLIGRFDGARSAAAAPFDLIGAVSGVLAALDPAATPVGPAAAPPDDAEATTASAGATASAAAAAEDRRPLFQSLFSDRGAAPASFVSDLWGRPAPASAPVQAPAPLAGSASTAAPASARATSPLFGR
jgi:hypothetical protein